jgi:hypothetical protein
MNKLICIHVFSFEMRKAIELGKPIIPLKLDSQMKWPPQGNMREAIGRLMYIDCTSADIQKKWNGPKYSELVLQIDDILESATDEMVP